MVLVLLCALVAGLGFAGLLAVARAVRGTTLTAARWWAAASLAVQWIATVAVSVLSDDDTGTWLGYVAMVSTLAPGAALLGAKRPQHQAWQFIVAALLAVLAMPPLQSWILGRAVAPEPDGIRATLIVGLALIAWINYLPTRMFLAASSTLASQACWAGTFWPIFQWGSPQSQELVGLALAASVPWLAVMAWHRQPRTALDETGLGNATQTWLDFRDLFGLAWSARVIERFNAAAQTEGSTIRLGWRGLEHAAPADREAGEAVDPQMLERAERQLRMLLRRFVSAEWIEAHGFAPSRGSR